MLGDIDLTFSGALEPLCILRITLYTVFYFLDCSWTIKTVRQGVYNICSLSPGMNSRFVILPKNRTQQVCLLIYLLICFIFFYLLGGKENKLHYTE